MGFADKLCKTSSCPLILLSYLRGIMEITAQTEDGIIMGIKHKLYNLAGLQFHPESILTPQGDRMMQNWLESL